MKMKRLGMIISAAIVLFAAVTVGGSFYMLNYSLAPEADRADTAKYFRQLVERHPDIAPWLDSLKACGGLRDTFIMMPSGERHHGYFIRTQQGARTAVVVHGWRNCGIDFMNIGRIYQLMGYNVIMPDLHAHGLSEGEAIAMGWNDRLDVLHWMTVAARMFNSDDFIVHGVSMGAATTMNMSGEQMPSAVKSVRFVEDCGYTCVWDEFRYKLSEEFGLPEFPLLYTTSLLCKMKYGWSFGEASPLEQVRKCHKPMFFIHGDDDHFVPSWMVQPLYKAKPGEKSLWITAGTAHAESYDDYPEEYIQHIINYCQ